MGIVLVITGGVVLMSVLGMGFDYLTKRRKRVDNETKAKVEQLEKEVHQLAQIVSERDQRVTQLESDLQFLNRLLEKK